MNFQDMISKLDHFWARQGCALLQPYDLEKGAGTFTPAAFFGSLSPASSAAAYVEPCRRPADGRFGGNSDRLGKYYQYQVVIKPPPADIQQVYLASLKGLGIDHAEHDIRWIEDDRESPALGASGVGWEIRLDGLAITRFTYFQQMASYELEPVTVEITYGLERLAMLAQKKKRIADVMWNDRLTYGEVHKGQEEQFSHYGFEEADVETLRADFDRWEKEVPRLAGKGYYLPAFDLVMKCSHNFNLLEARGAISVSERAALVKRIRDAARACASAYVGPGGTRAGKERADA